MFWRKYILAILICFLLVFIPSIYEDRRAIESNYGSICGTYIGDKVVVINRYRSMKEIFFEILTVEGDSKYFLKNISLSKKASLFFWEESSKETKKILSSMIIGNRYCVTFSNSYTEETSAKFQPVSYLIKID
ncbi:hypothetical protein [Acinetobacter haemolyticus]|uniref:hypothetical protein n=1 Tax=Acinetobacter haemolyticus TaxID=29430 RepID=UPI0021CD8581|nr:hypothetical protein [Acinetobacter haemolyticus]MCU4378205.1 hypothetical protein [Acinetobacter haemolyticus]